MSPEPRFEYKYILDHHRYYRIANAIVPYFTRDGISRRAPGRKYLVRSLYFDTYDYRAYQEKMTGVSQRAKWRLRCYAKTPKETEFVSVERKMRQGNIILKSSAQVSVTEYEQYMRSGSWNSNDPVLMDFEREVRARDLKPKAIVQYRREAFVSRDPGMARLTIDSDIEYMQGEVLFPSNPNFKKDLSRKLILEVKTHRDDISWINRIVREQDLGAVPNSKYCDSIEHTQKAIWF